MKKHYLMGLALMLASAPAFGQVKAASEPQLLLRASVGLMAPVWSPDGSQIAATSDNYVGIYVASNDGSNLRLITSDAGAGYKMVWSADGKTIEGRANLSKGALIERQMRSYNVTTGQWQAVSPRRRTAAQPGAEKATGIYAKMISEPAKAAAAIPALAKFAGSTIINPALSPDGSKIAFQIPGEGMWLINANGTDLVSLGKGSHPAWMPDNRTIVFTIIEDNGTQYTASTLMSTDTATGATATVAYMPSMLPLNPAISPDGARLAFENAIDASIYVINLKK